MKRSGNRRTSGSPVGAFAVISAGMIGLAVWGAALSFVADTTPVLAREPALLMRLPGCCYHYGYDPDLMFEVRVEEDGSIFIAEETEAVGGAELLDTLRGIGENFERPSCSMVISDHAKYQRVIDVLDALKAAGITDVAMLSMEGTEADSARFISPSPPVALLPMAPFPR